jgi:murein DD-endopeptidase MepM/ murein hydrolase activator NlpD
MLFKNHKKIFIIIIILLSIGLFLTILFSSLFFLKKISSAKSKKQNIIIKKHKFTYGDSLYKVLEKENISVDNIYKIINLLSSEVAVKKIKSNQAYEIETTTSGVFNAFCYYPTPIEKYRIYISTITQNYDLEIKKEELKTEILLLQGEIKSSLYEAILKNKNGKADIAVEMTEIFAWQIDFFTDTQVGDKFELLFENLYTDSGYSKLGKILLAKYIAKDYEYSAFYYDYGTDSGYYDENGKAMKRAFLKSPLNYKRISSYFSGSRLHPILKYRRPHLGIDYAARAGTPVVSIGDGKVILAGWVGGYGKMLKIRHSNNYESWYAHLNRFAVSAGSKIKQGQLIGFVGQTGMATGPHLDFRVKQNGKFINYLTLKIPSAFALKKEYMPDFNTKKTHYLNLISKLKQKGADKKGNSK